METIRRIEPVHNKKPDTDTRKSNIIIRLKDVRAALDEASEVTGMSLAYLVRLCVRRSLPAIKREFSEMAPAALKAIQEDAAKDEH